MAKQGILQLLVSLSEAPLRTCRYLNECCLCGEPITDGQKYRDRGYSRRAHLHCVTQRANGLADAINKYALGADEIIDRAIANALKSANDNLTGPASTPEAK